MKRVVLGILCVALFLSGCTVYHELPEPNGENEVITKEDSLLTDENTDEVKEEIVSEKEETATPEKTETSEATEEVTDPGESEITEENTSEIDSLPNDNNGWGFVKKKDSFPEFTKGQRDMMAKYNCIYAGNQSEKVLYLTFDEGYENGFTGQILDTLKEKGVPAAFFITGPYLEKNGDLIQRMVDEGHIVGNHSVNHPNMPSRGTKAAMQEEILNLDRRFFELYGQHMTYFRPPEGAYSERSLAATNDLGYKTVLWSFAYKDWETDNQRVRTTPLKA